MGRSAPGAELINGPSCRHLFERRHPVYDRLDDSIIPDSGVDHEMEEVAVRPVDPEVLLDVGCAILVHGLGKVDGGLIGLTLCRNRRTFSSNGA